MCGELHLFAPSAVPYIKHFYTRSQYYQYNDRTNETYIAGYINTASAIDAVDFKMTSGNITAGTVYMYGMV